MDQQHWQALLQGQPEHWLPTDQTCTPAVHPSLRAYEALAKYAECADAKYAEYEIYAEYVEICPLLHPHDKAYIIPW
jgi:hypothetical protein